MIPSQEARRRGGLARAKQFTSAYQQWARSFVSSESCARNGRKGAQATLDRYGADVLHERLRAWRLAHPSSLEQQVIDLLTQLGQQEGVDYYREYQPLPDWPRLTVDFAWPRGQHLILEVDGPVHALFDNDGQRADREGQRLHRLRAADWRVIVLGSADLQGCASALAALLGIDPVRGTGHVG